jgi:hypothetical protein
MWTLDEKTVHVYLHLGSMMLDGVNRVGKNAISQISQEKSATHFNCQKKQ